MLYGLWMCRSALSCAFPTAGQLQILRVFPAGCALLFDGLSLLLHVRVAANQQAFVLKLQSKACHRCADVEHAAMSDNVQHVLCIKQEWRQTMQIL